MDIIKFFYRRKSVKRKILEIKEEIFRLITKISDEDFFITYYGAYEIDPKNLVFWICLKSDKEKQRLSSNVNLNISLRNILQEKDYPTEARENVHIGFESQETVERQSNGNWYYHFK